MEEVGAAWVGVDHDAAAPAQLAIENNVAEHRAGVVRVSLGTNQWILAH